MIGVRCDWIESRGDMVRETRPETSRLLKEQVIYICSVNLMLFHLRHDAMLIAREPDTAAGSRFQ
jgi:hypothetical protein